MTNRPDGTFRRVPGTRSFPALPAVAALALLCAAAGADDPAGSVYRRSAAGPAAPPAPADTPPAPVDAPSAGAPPPAPAGPAPTEAPESAEERAARAERVVAASFAGLARAASITARVRHLVRFGDHVAKGSGRYIQSGVGEDQRYRYEYRLTTGQQECEVLEVCDGVSAWNFRRIEPYPPTVERIDVRRVGERLDALGVTHRKEQSAHLGGVQRHLCLLRHYFRFGSIVPGVIDDVPVWVVEGAWDRTTLAWILKDKADVINSPAGIAPHELPEGMPFAVRISISKRELFPTRVEWLAVPGKRPVAAAPPEVVGRLEFYDVRIGDPVDVSGFFYRPATEGLTDITETYVPSLFPLRP
ncbi:MAG: hypothetical protein ACKO3G_12315 [Planctomycetaceae bacterium]